MTTTTLNLYPSAAPDKFKTDDLNERLEKNQLMGIVSITQLLALRK